MKRIILMIIVSALLLTSCTWNSSPQKQTLAAFTDAMREYDVAAMTECLSAFPDKTPYVYLDDIFSDMKYCELYRLLYGDMTYKIRSTGKEQMTVEVTMPNVQKLYTDAVMMVTNLAISDKTLSDKLAEGEENGIILIQELMLSWAKQKDKVEMMKQKYTLSFTESDGRTVIVCDDELKAMMTGNFFRSKNQKSY